MKFFRRCLLCVLSLCLFSVAFSISASAEDIDVPAYHVYSESHGFLTGGSVATCTFTPGDSELQYKTYNRSIPAVSGHYFSVTHYFKTYGDVAFLKKDKTARITIENITEYLQAGSTNIYGAEAISGYVIYDDGRVTYISPEKVTKQDSYTVSFEVTALANITSIVIHGVYGLPSQYPPSATSGTNLMLYLGEWEGNGKEYVLSIDEVDPNTGLLENISNAISNGVVSGIANLGNKITDVFNAIVDLPATIWNFIENGLKNLFVPDEQYLVDYQDNWDSLLEDRFGAIYQVVNLTIESWEQIETADAQNTISMPEVSIDLPDDEVFSFGGYDVQIVPSGFEIIADALKMITGIACSILFINGLRKRYDSIMTR